DGKIAIWPDGWQTCNNSDGQKWIIQRADQDILVSDFYDDFIGVDGNAWNVMSFAHGRFNGERQDYVSDGSTVYSDGRKLHVDANWNGGVVLYYGDIKSGRLNTKNKRYYQNGVWSVAAHYWQGGNGGNHKGGWSAVWLLG